MEIVIGSVEICRIMRHNYLHKGGNKYMNYKRRIIKLVRRIENEKYLEYIYTLLKTFLET